MTITAMTEREVLWEERSYWVHACKIERTGERTAVLTITLVAPEEGMWAIDHLLHEQEIAVTTALPDEEQVAKWRKMCEEIIDKIPNEWSCGIR
jgi:hypothetical protein